MSSNHSFVRFNTAAEVNNPLYSHTCGLSKHQNTETASVRSVRHTAGCTYSISTLDTLSPTSSLLLPVVFSLVRGELLPAIVKNERVWWSASTRIIVREFAPQRRPVSAISDNLFLNTKKKLNVI